MVRPAAYLYQRPSCYYFCLNVPADLRSTVKRNQFRYSLGTQSVGQARLRAAFLSYWCRTLIAEVRAGTMKTFTTSDIERLVQHWLRQSLAMTEEARTLYGPYSVQMLREEVADLDRYDTSQRKALALRDYRTSDRIAEFTLTTEGYEVDRDSYAYRKLCRELLKAGVQHARLERLRSNGTYDADLPLLSEATVPRAPVEDIVPINGLTLEAAIEASSQPADASQASPVPISRVAAEFCSEMVAAKRWTDKTRRENGAIIQTMIEVMGDLHIAAMDKAKTRDYKAKLRRYPRNRNKDAHYQGKSLEQIWSMAKVQTLDIVTVNNHLNKLSAFFRWAQEQGYVEINPFEGLTIKIDDRAKDDVLPFEPAELQKIFHAPLYTEHRYRRAWQFWLPLLGLFTGARLEELCQLRMVDIREIDGVWCLDITTGDGLHLKTRASKRIVPIHPELVRIGLLEFVERQRKVGKTRLFPDLKPHGDKYGHYASKWFGSYLIYVHTSAIVEHSPKILSGGRHEQRQEGSSIPASFNGRPDHREPAAGAAAGR